MAPSHGPRSCRTALSGLAVLGFVTIQVPAAGERPHPMHGRGVRSREPWESRKFDKGFARGVMRLYGGGQRLSFLNKRVETPVNATGAEILKNATTLDALQVPEYRDLAITENSGEFPEIGRLDGLQQLDESDDDDEPDVGSVVGSSEFEDIREVSKKHVDSQAEKLRNIITYGTVNPVYQREKRESSVRKHSSDSTTTSLHSSLSLEAREAERIPGADLMGERRRKLFKKRSIRERSSDYRKKLRKEYEAVYWGDPNRITSSKIELYPDLKSWASDMLRTMREGRFKSRLIASRLVYYEVQRQLERFKNHGSAPSLLLHLQRVAGSMEDTEDHLLKMKTQDREYLLAYVSEAIARDKSLSEKDQARYGTKLSSLSLENLKTLAISCRLTPYWDQMEGLLLALMAFRGYNLTETKMSANKRFREPTPLEIVQNEMYADKYRPRFAIKDD
ncbi:hypothetical protein AAMO2058_000922500 [Amorphochlora amoebiformis]